MSKIVYLSLKKGITARDYWDHAFLNDILEDVDIEKADRTLVVIPGAYQYDIIPKINAELAKYKKVLVMIMSDEEKKFDTRELKHPDMILYTQYANGGRVFPTGYPTNTRKILKEIGYREKSMDWFFSGQVNHYRRSQLMEVLRKLNGGVLQENDGFGKGMEHAKYLRLMAEAKVVPCPSGNIVPDSFRLYEALEAGCIPVVDDQSPLRSVRENFWKRLFGEIPFLSYTTLEDFNNYLKMEIRSENRDNMVYSWWINRKYQIKEQLKRDLGIPEEEIIAVIPVSPIPSNPDTSMIKETIESIRAHLPDAPILVTIDGVREEQEHMREKYTKFIKKFLWECNFEYKNVLPVIFSTHHHQTGMMKVVLDGISTPMILYVEHDTPLTPNKFIDWEKCKNDIKRGVAKVIRFHFEAEIPKPHKHLMLGEPKNGLQKTIQWSQRPHLASRDIYNVIMSLFSKDSNCFIEDFLHGVIQDNYTLKDMDGWNLWKLHIYHPEGDIKRSYNLDGRKDDKKYVEEQIW